MNKSHLIIAGTNKSGTTSLFRYLADHPNVSSSHVKELRFFLSDNPDLEAYLDNFTRDGQTQVYLEASPQYLDAGAEVAGRIHALLPDAQLLFLLRNPIDRLRSFFNSFQSRQAKLVDGMTFDQFANIAVDSVNEENSRAELKEFQREILRGCYAEHLLKYLDVFDANQLHVMFFDDLQHDTANVVKTVCQRISLDPSYFDSYQFAVENRTRNYHSSALHKFAHRINVRFESFFNRHRGTKVWIRNLYTRFNETKGATDDTSNPASLELFYGQRNTLLKQLLEKHYSGISLPGWLNE